MVLHQFLAIYPLFKSGKTLQCHLIFRSWVDDVMARATPMITDKTGPDHESLRQYKITLNLSM